jgi:hypothetical protein
VRVVKMNGTGVDLNLFRFDYWGTWAAFFLNQHGHLYARYGLRKNKEAQDESLMSLAGLRTVMKQVLEAHQTEGDRKPAAPAAAPLFPESFAAAPADMRSGKTCMHCHHVWIYGEKERPRPFPWTSPEIPLPEKIGLSLDRDLGNVVAAVAPDGAAARAGIQPKDRIVSMNQTAVYSAADVAWAINLLPKGRTIQVTLLRGTSRSETTLAP